METTFISIHNLDEEAAILYTSDSIIDILGFTPDEVVGRSAWEFFPAEQLPGYQKWHKEKVTMDKAAVLAYCHVKNSDGEWICCECCFSIVYDVMIVCTSVYKRGMSSDKRALEAPIVRRIFTSSPKDPRYHMLSHISQKFATPAKQQQHEPRAALFLNRFTRTMSIMYATSGIQDIIGISADDMRGRSFYYCIAENCLQDAIKCLEQAKGNDSIAYLRFWFRDPRQDDQPPPPDDDSDEEMTTDVSTDYEEGGVNLRSRSSNSSQAVESGDGMDVDDEGAQMRDPDSRTSSKDSTLTPDTHEAIFGEERAAPSSASSMGSSTDLRPPEPIELEAVISCASDGLVVCLRKARPVIPPPTHRPSQPMYQNGLFAAPWGDQPVLPRVEQRAGAGFTPSFAPALGPHGAHHATTPSRAALTHDSDFMHAIRDQAVFAWALTGINGTIAEYAHGKPLGESLPPEGLPVWASDRRHNEDGDTGSEGFRDGREMLGSASRSPLGGRSDRHLFGDPGLDRAGSYGTRSAGGGGASGDGSCNGGSKGGTPYSGPR